MDSSKSFNEYVAWIIINIFLPISPLILKMLIAFFGDSEVLKVDIFDSVEVVFYNLFVSITVLNMLAKIQSCIENILKYIFIFICIIDLIVLFLIYTDSANDKCRAYATVFSILIPIFAMIYKLRNID